MAEPHVPSGDVYRLEVGGLLYEVHDDARGTIYRIEPNGSRRRVRSYTQRQMVVEAMAAEIEGAWWQRLGRWLSGLVPWT